MQVTTRRCFDKGVWILIYIIMMSDLIFCFLTFFYVDKDIQLKTLMPIVLTILSSITLTLLAINWFHGFMTENSKMFMCGLTLALSSLDLLLVLYNYIGQDLNHNIVFLLMSLLGLICRFPMIILLWREVPVKSYIGHFKHIGSKTFIMNQQNMTSLFGQLYYQDKRISDSFRDQFGGIVDILRDHENKTFKLRFEYEMIEGKFSKRFLLLLKYSFVHDDLRCQTYHVVELDELKSEYESLAKFDGQFQELNKSGSYIMNANGVIVENFDDPTLSD
jgi:hypothetical protein